MLITYQTIGSSPLLLLLYKGKLRYVEVSWWMHWIVTPCTQQIESAMTSTDFEKDT